MSDNVSFYGLLYARFTSDLAAELRQDVYGEDLGQCGWRTVTEQADIVEFLRLFPDSKVLDVAYGAGGASICLVERTGCRLTGLDLEADAIAHANARAAAHGLSDRAVFACLDCSTRLPFADGSFDAVLCIDAINHLPDRFAVLAEWARLLCPGGRLIFSDLAILTGAVAKSELDIRAIDLFFWFRPASTRLLLRPSASTCCAATTALLPRLS